MTLSIEQKALLFARLPTILNGVQVNKYLRDRFTMSPVVYPAMEVDILTEGVKKAWNTHGPVTTARNDDTQEYDEIYGELDEATISVTLWSEDRDELRMMADELEFAIKPIGWGLGLYWPEHHMKVSNVKSVQWLPPFPDEFTQKHTWRAVIDFTVEYRWDATLIAPEIRAFEYLFTGVGRPFVTTPPVVATLPKLYSFMPGAYGMDMLLKGWRAAYTMDLLCESSVDASYGMSLLVK